VRFSALEPLTRTTGVNPNSPEARYRMFDRVPTAVNARYPTSIMIEEGREVLLAHPPSTIEFQMDPSARRISGRFGMIPGAYTPPNNTDGAEFIVDWVGLDGQTTRLFSRWLRPLYVTADRGMQAFDAALPGGGGRLVLRITPGPNDDIVCDWAYWTDVRFHPLPP